MKAIIEVDVPDFQIGQEVSIYFKDTMMIKGVVQEPCDDAINRDMALEKMADYVASGYADSAEDFEEYSRIICQLPPVNPQPKTGHWIKSRDCYGNYHFTCSECGNDIATQYADNWEDKYCSDCGCRMVEPQESEVEDAT